MGIPSFYRWLVEKYPLAVANVVEDPPYTTIDGVEIPLDSSKPNPNGMEFDNLYLDMNGIIHPCFHPEGQPPPKSYDEVFKSVFKYTDRIFSIVRPRKLLYMAIDGVAPRAKMNQQRARRFKAAKEAADAAAKERPENVIEAEGEKLQSMDSNIITPGTEFMASLSAALQYYIHLRMNTDPGWRGVKVILSDASVVGEGEHKTMSYIRSQRNRNGYDPNTRHCLYGLDADLIMLALASHEVHFSILREDVAKVQHNMGRSQKWKDFKHRNLIHGNRYLVKGELGDKEAHDYISSQKFQFFNVWILREYLAHEMNIPRAEKLERLLDDFVFMCLFVGNDFLPHVPSLEISEGAIELLMTVYKKEFVKMGGYLTESFKVNLKRVEHFMQAVGCHEDAIFRRRSQVQKGYATSKAKQGSTEARNLPHPKQNSQTFWSTVDLTSKSTDQLFPSFGAKESKPPLANEMANGTSEIVHNSDAKELKGTPSKAMANGASETVDNIKLGEEGWKGRFYFEKFKAKTEDERDCIRKHAVLKYIEGMYWVMHYYYEGVCSWQWFYPYHYAPFASDFYDLENIQIHFMLGQPFKPFDQLMGVLPPASAHALPLAYRGLMLDPSSPILDLYPTDFELDMNGKRHEWQAICKLPFIEESRLLTETAKVEHTLTDEEKRRNSLGMDMLFVHFSHPLEGTIYTLSNRSKCHSKLTEAKAKCTIDPKISGGMNGYIYISDRTVGPRDINSPVGDMENITANKVLTVFYGYPARQAHSSKLPKGVVMPRMSIRKEDAPVVSVLWHEKSGVLGRVHYERPIAKSVSGSCLVTLAHQLVLEYYADKRKENLDPSVFERLIARFVPSRPNELKKKPVEKVPKKENNVAGTESGKRKRKRRAAAKGRQDNEVVSILGDRAVSDPPCPTQSNSIEVERPEKRNNSFAATTSVREKCMSGAPDDKSQEHVTSAVLFGHSAIDAPLNPTLPDSVVVHVENMDLGKAVETVPEKEHAAAGTVSGKKKRRRKASATGRQVSEAALVLGHSALSDPSCPTEPNLKETTKPAATTTARGKYMSAAPEDKSQEHVTSAVLVGHSATHAPLELTLPDCVVVHERNMDPGSCMDLGKSEKVLEKENAVTGTVSGKKKRKRKASATRRQVSEAALVLAHSALSDPSAPTELNFIETTKPEERENSFAATTSVREKCMSGAPDDKSQEHITSAVLVGHSAIDAPKLVSEAALVLGHSALSDPSCPTEPNLKETTKPEERENDFAATTTAREKYMSGSPEDKSQEHVTSAVLVGHSATHAPLELTLPDCVVVHEKNMDPGSCMDLGKSEEKVLEKENAVAGAVSGKKKRKRKASATRRQVSEAALVLTYSALSDPSAPTELNFLETTKPEERENSFAATTSVREKCMSGAPDNKSQEHITSAVLVGHRAIDAPKLVSEAALVLGHSALSDPSCPTEPNLKETTKPEERENDFAATTTAREEYMSGAPEDKSQEHVTSAVLVGHSATGAPLELTLPDCVVVHEKNMDPGSCMDLGKSEEKVLEKENAVAGTVSGKKKRKRKASATRRQVSEAGLVLAHSALIDPSAPTELNFLETTKPEERENSFAATTSVREKCMSGAPDDKSQEHITSAVLVGHRAIDAPKLVSEAALVLGHSALSDPSCPTEPNLKETTKPGERENDFAAATTAREKYMSGAPEDKSQEHVTSAVLVGHSATDAPLELTLPDCVVVHEKNIDPGSCMDLGKSEEKVLEKENAVAGTVSGKKKRKRKASATRRQVSEAALVLAHSALSDPSAPTELNFIETTKPEERENSFAATTSVREKCMSGAPDDKSQEHITSAVLVGHRDIDAPKLGGNS